jgi:hypothetical protein
VTPTKLRTELTARFADRRGVLHRQSQVARQIVKKLVDGPIMFTPKRDSEGRGYYEFEAEGILAKLLGNVDPILVTSPTRFGALRADLAFWIPRSRGGNRPNFPLCAWTMQSRTRTSDRAGARAPLGCAKVAVHGSSRVDATSDTVGRRADHLRTTAVRPMPTSNSTAPASNPSITEPKTRFCRPRACGRRLDRYEREPERPRTWHLS